MRHPPKQTKRKNDRMATRECPRCNEERLVEWFGDKDAPYAICLSCRVEINGPKKTKQGDSVQFRANCAICNSAILGRNEICDRCKRGIELFEGSVKLLGRATSYQGRHLRGKKRKSKKFKPRNSKLQRLIKSQRDDARDNHLRFEHAISK